MPFTPTLFPGLIIIEPNILTDSRGYFFEAYNEQHYRNNNIGETFIQDNQSRSTYGVVRGLHYQRPPHAQTKLVRVLAGNILDTVLDLRVGSPTYGETFSIELSADNKKQLLIPKGFAHGFAVLSEVAEVIYKCDEYYNRESEAGILHSDANLHIDWKIPADKIIISEKDKLLPLFNSISSEFTFIQY